MKGVFCNLGVFLVVSDVMSAWSTGRVRVIRGAQLAINPGLTRINPRYAGVVITHRLYANAYDIYNLFFCYVFKTVNVL
jgi:hypothetical protein